MSRKFLKSFFILFIVGVIGIFAIAITSLTEHFEDMAKEKEKEKEKRIEARQEIEKKKEEVIEKKQIELVSNYLDLPEEKFFIEDYSEFYKGTTGYEVIAEGIEYEVSFNNDFTKITKFVEMPKNDSNYCSDSSTDSDIDSTHFPKIKTKSSSKRR